MRKISYALYDLANSAYSVIIITFIISAYFAKQIVGDVQLGAAYWQWTAGLCGIVVALTGPLLGSYADKIVNGKEKLLKIFTFLCVLTTCLFWFCKPQESFIFLTLIIFFISNYFYETAQLFYNSILKKFSNDSNIGKTSGFGFALGYIGSIPILLFILYYFIIPQQTLFNLDKEKFENIRFVPYIVALWFLIFSLPLFYSLNKKKTNPINTSLNLNQKKSFLKDIINIVWNNKLTNTGKFLIARMVYADALIVLIAGGGVYATGVFNYTSKELLSLAIYGNLVAFLGVLIGGYLNDKFFSKNIIMICICALTLAVIYGSLIAETKKEFFNTVMFISLFIGTIQSASRVLMSKLLQSENLGKGFGLFSFSGKITSFFGPILVGTTTFMFSQRIGLLSVSILFVIGLILMIGVQKL